MEAANKPKKPRKGKQSIIYMTGKLHKDSLSS